MSIKIDGPISDRCHYKKRNYNIWVRTLLWWVMIPITIIKRCLFRRIWFVQPKSRSFGKCAAVVVFAAVGLSWQQLLRAPGGAWYFEDSEVSYFQFATFSKKKNWTLLVQYGKLEFSMHGTSKFPKICALEQILHCAENNVKNHIETLRDIKKSYSFYISPYDIHRRPPSP